MAAWSAAAPQLSLQAWSLHRPTHLLSATHVTSCLQAAISSAQLAVKHFACTLQSAGQLLSDSGATHLPSPQTAAAGQSPGQVCVVSPPLQTPSPHLIAGGQSLGQVLVVSLPLQMPSPQLVLATHWLLLQFLPFGHSPHGSGQPPTKPQAAPLLSQQAALQSLGQLEAVSEPLHCPSPQTVASLQSAGQLDGVSPCSHLPLPQDVPPGIRLFFWPQTCSAP